MNPDQKSERKIILSEETLLQAINEWLDSADADELARVVGEMFGGKCYPASGYKYGEQDNYEFYLDENYYGGLEEYGKVIETPKK